MRLIIKGNVSKKILRYAPAALLRTNGTRQNPFVVSASPSTDAQDKLREQLARRSLGEGWESNHLASIIFQFLIYFSMIIPYSAYAFFEYDRAIMESQKGNWPQATTRFKKVLAEQPDRADILYDAGISAYKNAEFDKALIYFMKAGDSINAPQQLREQAYFNAGNAQVQLKQLQQATESYDKVLTLNPDHEKAKHNKEVVKKMLESADAKAKADSQEEKKKEEESADAKAMADRQKTEEQNKEQSQEQQQENNKQQKQDKQNKEQENKQQENNAQQKKEKEKKEQQQKQNKDKEHNSQQQEQQKKESTEQSADAKAKADKQTAQKLSAALEHVLKEREKKDAQLNKKMIKAMATETHHGGKNDINCW